MARSFFISAITGCIIFACTTNPDSGKSKPEAMFADGIWKGTIVSNTKDIPFIFEVSTVGDNFQIHLINGKERFLIDDVNISGDSVHISVAIFDAAIHARISDGNLKGVYVKNYVSDYRLPFSAIYNDTARFGNVGTATTDFSGRWEVDLIRFVERIKLFIGPQPATIVFWREL